jgi:hypothetical protein
MHVHDSRCGLVGAEHHAVELRFPIFLLREGVGRNLLQIMPIHQILQGLGCLLLTERVFIDSILIMRRSCLSVASWSRSAEHAQPKVDAKTISDTNRTLVSRIGGPFGYAFLLYLESPAFLAKIPVVASRSQTSDQLPVSRLSETDPLPKIEQT